MILDLAAPPEGFFEDPFPVYRRLRAEAPVQPLPDGSLVLSAHADLDRVYRDARRFVSDKREVFAPKFGTDAPLYEHHTTSLVFNDPPLHTRVRRVMTGAMTPRALQRMEPGLVALVDGLLDRLEREADLVPDFAAAIPVEVIGNLLDIPRDARAPLRDWSLAILGALEPRLSPETEAAGNRAVTEFKALLAGIVADRRARPGDPETDVLTRLLAAEDGLSETELLQNCIFILNAGHETTTNLIGNALALLDRDREARARLIAEPDLVAPMIEEALRLESPNQFGNRLTAAAVEIGGREVPAGTDLHLCIGAANRDPEVFAAPDAIRLDRGAARHLAFGGGVHTCVGLSLARMEGRVALSRFLARFPGYEIRPGARHARRLRFRGYATLPARLG